MAKFIFAWSSDEDRDVLCVSEENYFKENQAMNDSYSDEDYEELSAALADVGCYELSESIYEISYLNKDEVTEALDALADFEFSQDFQDFIDD